MKAINLRTEYLVCPIGIDTTIPRLFWNCQGGISQIAYQILAYGETNEVAWDTGKVIESTMTHIPYEGKELHSRDRINWKVKLWDENDSEGEWSEVTYFEMGLLHQTDWKASWITGTMFQRRKKDIR